MAKRDIKKLASKIFNICKPTLSPLTPEEKEELRERIALAIKQEQLS